ncbi:putative calcium-transporting ATPase 13, plasma membrane-type [Juglans microcarpa x Juglans regia]|uniref:putative calcium-transporting ATPase 13, plasma membrane-type n=1 Tax=Juglans microcarpa x Juglans regia TaxID=2249226 RepID=UPI001B7F3900|nr:putative calcium-transporting ATPase 13, plasma membrane-type [Juglans microcarpa x Juglans regia]
MSKDGLCQRNLSNMEKQKGWDREVIGSVGISSAPPDNVCLLNVNLEDENDNDTASDSELNQANIASMVKEMNLVSLQKFGGIQGVAKVLHTDLNKGIDERNLRIYTANSLSPTDQASPGRGFIKILIGNLNDVCIIIQLTMGAALAIIFGAIFRQEGAWEIGIIIIVSVIFLLVLPPSLDEFLSEKITMISGQEIPLGIQRAKVYVIRGQGLRQEVHIGDIFVGDIVCLEEGYRVPADGMLVSGEFLKLDDGSTIDDQKPFLFYGAKVIDGEGRMLVTSVGKNTRLGHLMSQVTHFPDKIPGAVAIYKVNTISQIMGLVFTFLIATVLFIRFKLGDEDVQSNIPVLKAKTTMLNKVINKISMNANGIIKIFATSLVGIKGGMPLVIRCAIVWRMKKILSDKAYIKRPLACLTMGSVSTICINTIGLDHVAVDEDMNGIRKAIECLKNVGINVILVSEDIVSVSADIAKNFSMLLGSNGLVLEGKEFRNYSDEERMSKVDRIKVMGCCSPSDKLLLVQCLKEKGHVVAMVGGRTNDVPALAEADVGIVMKANSSEMASGSADIIIRDSNFGLMVADVVKLGRSIYKGTRKYVPFLLTMSVVGRPLMTTITACSLEYFPISIIEQLLANFFVSFLSALALLTEPPTEELMKKCLRVHTTTFFNKAMWRNLVLQVIYQTTILVMFQFKGQAILNISQKVSNTIIFNSFVICQVFNLFNAREMEKKNVFRGVLHNGWFWVAVTGILAVQVIILGIETRSVSNPIWNLVPWVVPCLIGMGMLAIDWASKFILGFIMD